MAHTPGPWKWWTSNSLRRLTSHHLPGGQIEFDGNVLHAYRSAGDGVADIAVSDDDMQLIAAAPELLSALEQMLDDMHGDGDLCVCQHTKDQALAAYEKATGEKFAVTA